MSLTSISYNVGSGILTQSVDLNQLEADTCTFAKYRESANGYIMAGNMGWNYDVTGYTFSMSINVRAAISAVSANLQVNGPATLEKFSVIQVIAADKFNGVDYLVLEMFDSQYSYMAPFYCIGPKIGPQKIDNANANCFIKFGDLYGVPFFNSMGASESYPTVCDCSKSTGHLPICDKFDFLTGVLLLTTR